MAVTKKELIRDMAAGSDITMVEAEKALNAFMSSVEDAVASGEGVTLKGFGSFKRVTRQAKDGNTVIGGAYSLPKRYGMKFSPASNLKEKLKGIAVSD